MRREWATEPLAAHSVEWINARQEEVHVFKSQGQRSPIALELSKSSMRLIQLSSVSTAPAVHAAATLPAAKGILEEGPLDESALRRLKDALKHGKFSGTQCTLSLPASAVFTECVEVPALAWDELRESVAWTAVDRLGVEKDELVAGHLGVRNGTLGGSTQEVLVVAAHKSIVARALHLLSMAGLQTQRAELGSIAAMRLCWQGSIDSGRLHPLGFLHLESDRASLALLGTHGLSYFRSFEWHTSADLDPDLVPVAGDEGDSKAWRWRQLGEHVLQCLRHVERRTPGSWPEAIRVSGPLAEEPGLASAIGSVCGSAAEVFDTTKRVDWSSVPAGAGSRAAWTASIATLLGGERSAQPRQTRRVA